MTDDDIIASLLPEIAYSDEDRQDMAALTEDTIVRFFGLPMKFGDPKWFNTEEGLRAQLKAFTNPKGLVYYIKVTNHRIQVQKKAVDRS